MASRLKLSCSTTLSLTLSRSAPSSKGFETGGSVSSLRPILWARYVQIQGKWFVIDLCLQGMDFRNLVRVILWMAPRTFCSLVQKAGRCARDFAKLGEVIAIVSKQYLGSNAVGTDDVPDELAQTRAERDGEFAEPSTKKGKVKGKAKAQPPLALHDGAHLREFLCTTECRRKVWNRYFENHKKRTSYSSAMFFRADSSPNRSFFASTTSRGCSLLR